MLKHSLLELIYKMDILSWHLYFSPELQRENLFQEALRVSRKNTKIEIKITLNL